MAVRFTALAQTFTATMGLGDHANSTISCWTKISVQHAAYTPIITLSNGTAGSDFLAIVTQPSGTGMLGMDETTDTGTPITTTVGTWYYTAVVNTGATGTLYMRNAAAETTWSTQTFSGTGSTTPWDQLNISSTPWSLYLNGCICAVKLWTAALTQAELEREARQYMPARTDQLQAWYPLIVPENVDYSGNGQTLAGGSGTVQEDGPNIAWRSLGRGSTDAVVPQSVVAVGDHAFVSPVLNVSGVPTSYRVTAGPNADATFGMTVSGVTTSNVVPAGTMSEIFTGAALASDVTFAGLETTDSGV